MISPGGEPPARGVGTAGSTRLPGLDAGRHDRTRGSIALSRERCTSCLLCVKECPVWCIELDAHAETLPAATPRGRPRTVHVLDDFRIDWGLCMACGICVEVCPFDALFWTPVRPGARDERRALVHAADHLVGLLCEVPGEAPSG